MENIQCFYYTHRDILTKRSFLGEIFKKERYFFGKIRDTSEFFDHLIVYSCMLLIKDSF